jgi:LysM repeat protein
MKNKFHVFIASFIVMMVLGVISSSAVNAMEDDYVIQENDTLWNIANQYGVSVEDIMVENGLETDIIMQGVVLHIPANDNNEVIDDVVDTTIDEVIDTLDDYEVDETVEDNSVSEADESVYKDSYSSGTVLSISDVYCSLGDASYYNISLAAQYLEDYVLYPGEEFSWEQVLGGNTYEQGYVAGGAFSNGKTVQSPGGGVCVLSTALMQAARSAGLTITEKWQHSQYVSYASGDDEAAVSFGSKDLKFYNGLGYPVKFKFNLSYTDTIVYVVRY